MLEPYAALQNEQCEIVVHQNCLTALLCVQCGDALLDQISLNDVTSDWKGFRYWPVMARERIMNWVFSLRGLCSVTC